MLLLQLSHREADACKSLHKKQYCIVFISVDSCNSTNLIAINFLHLKVGNIPSGSHADPKHLSIQS